MNIWSNEAAVDFFSDKHAAEIEAEHKERTRRIENAAHAISKVADPQTKVALLCLLALIEQRT